MMMMRYSCPIVLFLVALSMVLYLILYRQAFISRMISIEPNTYRSQGFEYNRRAFNATLGNLNFSLVEKIVLNVDRHPGLTKKCKSVFIFSGMIRTFWSKRYYENMIDKISRKMGDSGFSLVLYLTESDESCEVQQRGKEQKLLTFQKSQVIELLNNIGSYARKKNKGCHILVTKYCLSKAKDISYNAHNDRMQSMWIAIGRSYQLMRNLWRDVEFDFYFRMRTDICSSIPHQAYLDDFKLKTRKRFIAVNLLKKFNCGRNMYFLSDRFAVMDHLGADIYFNTWKVWEKVNPASTLQMGRVGGIVCRLIGWSTGECPLSAWVDEYKPILYSIGRTGDPVWRMSNFTHFFMQNHKKIHGLSSVLKKCSNSKSNGILEKFRVLKCQHHPT